MNENEIATIAERLIAEIDDTPTDSIIDEILDHDAHDDDHDADDETCDAIRARILAHFYDE